MGDSCRYVHNQIESVRALFLEGGDLTTTYPAEPIDNQLHVDVDRDGASDLPKDTIINQATSTKRVKYFDDNSWHMPLYTLKNPRQIRSLNSESLSTLIGSGITAWRSELFSPHQTIAQLFELDDSPLAQIPYEQIFNFTNVVMDTIQSIRDADWAVTNEYSYLWERGVWVTNAYHRFQVALNELTNYAEGLHSLLMGRLSPHVLDSYTAERAIGHLTSTLLAHGLKPSISQLAEVYQLPVSVLAFRDGRVEVLVHVPAHRVAARKLQVLQYIPSPIKLADHRYIVPDPAHKVLVVNDDKTLFREMDLSELAMCDHEFGSWYCDHANYLTGRVASSCIQGLFLSNPQQVIDACRVSIIDPVNSLVQLGSNDFLLYHREMQKIEISCPKTPKESLAFSGLRQITLPAGCYASSGDFAFEGTLATESERLCISKQPLDLSSHFNGTLFKDSELDMALAEMNSVVKEEGQAVSFQRLQKLTSERYWERVYSWLYGALALLTALYSVITSLWWGTPLRSVVRKLKGRFSNRPPRPMPRFREEIPLRRGDDDDDQGGEEVTFSPAQLRRLTALGTLPTPAPRTSTNYPSPASPRSILKRSPSYNERLRSSGERTSSFRKAPSTTDLENTMLEVENHLNKMKNLVKTTCSVYGSTRSLRSVGFERGEPSKYLLTRSDSSTEDEGNEMEEETDKEEIERMEEEKKMKTEKKLEKERKSEN